MADTKKNPESVLNELIPLIPDQYQDLIKAAKNVVEKTSDDRSTLFDFFFFLKDFFEGIHSQAPEHDDVEAKRQKTENTAKASATNQAAPSTGARNPGEKNDSQPSVTHQEAPNQGLEEHKEEHGGIGAETGESGTATGSQIQGSDISLEDLQRSIPYEYKNLFEPAKLFVKKNKDATSVLMEFFNHLKSFSENGKKKNVSSNRMPKQVMVHSVVAGRTFGADEALLRKVSNCKESIVLTHDLQKCNIIVVFCPVTTRPGSDAQEAMSKIPGEKPVILVLMHHTRKPEHATEGTTWSETYGNIVLAVDVLFHQTKQGLLDCEKNENAVRQIQKVLMEQTEQKVDGKKFKFFFQPKKTF